MENNDQFEAPAFEMVDESNKDTEPDAFLEPL